MSTSRAFVEQPEIVYCSEAEGRLALPLHLLQGPPQGRGSNQKFVGLSPVIPSQYSTIAYGFLADQMVLFYSFLNKKRMVIDESNGFSHSSRITSNPGTSRWFRNPFLF